LQDSTPTPDGRTVRRQRVEGVGTKITYRRIAVCGLFSMFLGFLMQLLALVSSPTSCS
jgi:hypothetical protein